MRISTSMLNQNAVNAIMQDEQRWLRRRTSCPRGKSVNTPADNPVATVQLLQLNNTSSQYQQYVSNGQSCQYQPDARGAGADQFDHHAAIDPRSGGAGQHRLQQRLRPAEHRHPDQRARKPAAGHCQQPERPGRVPVRGLFHRHAAVRARQQRLDELRRRQRARTRADQRRHLGADRAMPVRPYS